MGRRLSIAAAVAALALAAPILYHLISAHLGAAWSAAHWRFLARFWAGAYVCEPHAYTTEIVSVDPLLIYIRDFIPAAEAAALIAAGESDLAPSEVTKDRRNQHTSDRTSSSAALPASDPAVACVLGRAEAFLGGLLDFPSPEKRGGRGSAEMGPPQLVRYTAGQRFNLHHDWYERPQRARRDKAHLGRAWNRAASFFAVLEAEGCAGGETHFPYVKPAAPPKTAARRAGNSTSQSASSEWYELDGEDRDGGGIAFRPVRGNAVFWVNLHANGTGDKRTMHAGLPLLEGRKTAMNIWPRQYYS
ncbi:hypothetical protein BJ166DRAFT_282018 [Pestalotiopsis sp. NC0098]|nr:hypothetical protein BJ166DRAFT_282018 [Pestalotiopsis sp. NC0098]